MGKKSQKRLPLEMQLEGWKVVEKEGSAPTLQSDHSKGGPRGGSPYCRENSTSART